MKKFFGPFLLLIDDGTGQRVWCIAHKGIRIAISVPEADLDKALVELGEYASTLKRLPKGWTPQWYVPKRQPGNYIYFISSEDVRNFPIKIGRTDGPVVARLAALQCGCPYKLKVLGLMQDSAERERRLHIGFHSSRLSGEWFKRTKELLKFIADLPPLWPEDPSP